MPKFALIFLFLLQYATSIFSQAKFTQNEPDTNLIKFTASQFALHVLQRKNVDSVLKYCTAPFYMLGKEPNTFKAKSEIRKFLIENYAKAAIKKSDFSIESLLIESTPQEFPPKIKSNTICIKLTIRYLHMGEGDSEYLQYVTIIVSKFTPYSIVGIRE
jgi:hypothetical protein